MNKADNHKFLSVMITGLALVIIVLLIVLIGDKDHDDSRLSDANKQTKSTEVRMKKRLQMRMVP